MGGILLRLDWEPLREHVLAAEEGVKEFPWNSGGKASPPYGGDSGMTMVWVLLPFGLRGFAGGRA